jgi:hypothetical protein
MMLPGNAFGRAGPHGRRAPLYLASIGIATGLSVGGRWGGAVSFRDVCEPAMIRLHEVW